MNLIKKIFTLTASMCLTAGVFASPVTIKIASVAPARSSWDVQQRQIAKEWATITNGEVILQFMTSDAMGGESGVVKKLNAVRPGQKAPIGGAIFTSMGLSDFAPDSNVMTLCAPCLFRSQDEVNAVLEKFTPTMQKALDDKGYVVLGWFNIGWAYFFTSKPAHVPNELKKLRLAVGGGETGQALEHRPAQGQSRVALSADGPGHRGGCEGTGHVLPGGSGSNQHHPGAGQSLGPGHQHLAGFHVQKHSARRAAVLVFDDLDGGGEGDDSFSSEYS